MSQTVLNSRMQPSRAGGRVRTPATVSSLPREAFRDLRIRDQRAIFGIVGPLGFALIVAKEENNACSMKQLKAS